jgi:cation diffusion facilitator family transporter
VSSEKLQRNTIIGLVASVLLAAGKLVAGILGQSSALIADAIESLADTVGSVIVWHALRMAEKPPDEKHPYGYGRAETMAALAVGALLLVAAVIIIVKAAEAMLTPHSAPAAWTLIVLIAVIITKEALFRVILQGAELAASDAAHADAWHQRSDAITSGAALLGVTLAVWGPKWFGEPRLVYADEVAAIAAGGIIALTALRLMRPAWSESLDAAAPEQGKLVAARASTIEGVVCVEIVRARKSGRWFYVDLHLHVDPQWSVEQAHALSGKVRATIRKEHARVRDVLIHIEPATSEEVAKHAAMRAARPDSR